MIAMYTMHDRRWLLLGRKQRDVLGEMLDRALLDDEPATLEEDEGVREARAEIARGDVLSADEIRREVI